MLQTEEGQQQMEKQMQKEFAEENLIFWKVRRPPRGHITNLISWMALLPDDERSRALHTSHTSHTLHTLQAARAYRLLPDDERLAEAKKMKKQYVVEGADEQAASACVRDMRYTEEADQEAESARLRRYSSCA